MKERAFGQACGVCGGSHAPDQHYEIEEGKLLPKDSAVAKAHWNRKLEEEGNHRRTEGQWMERLYKAQADAARASKAGGVTQEQKIALMFYERAVENIRKDNRLSVWEAGLPEDIRLKFRNPFHLPAFRDVKLIPWNELGSLQSEFGDYEILNAEYVETVSRHLLEKITELLGNDPSVTILEVGAGSGRLTYFLQEAVLSRLSAEDRSRVRFRAIDNFSWNLTPVFPVENLDYKEAFGKEQPQIVIASWPYSVNWWEGPASVQEYILLGEAQACWGGQSSEVFEAEVRRLRMEARERGEEEGFVEPKWDDHQWEDIAGFRQRLFREATEVQTGKTGHSITSILEKTK